MWYLLLHHGASVASFKRGVWQIKIKLYWVTSGYGDAWPEQWTSPPVLLENSILYAGSWTKIGPWRSSDVVSACVGYKNTHEGVRFNLQMNEQSGALEKCVKEIDDENSGHSPRIKLSCSSKNNRRATTAFMRRPHAPIFMSTFHAH